MIRRFAALVSALALVAACGGGRTVELAPPVAEPATVRATSSGELIGFSVDAVGAHVWRSVPFAAPPVGDLRWRAPRPVSAWDGMREALDHAPWCVQMQTALDGRDAEIGALAGQEDCLYLNVYAPAMTAEQAAAANLPVMMWIHGGGNVWGRAEQYDASVLAARHNVLVVVIQYRLGPLGWFAHPAIRASGETPDDETANFAVLDMVAALEWIQAEIDAFGGDPSRVTIFGESAGGHNVGALLASPKAAGLFHRAILQSGSFMSMPLSEAEGLTGDDPDAGLRVARRLVDGEAEPTAEMLRAVSADALFDAYETRDDDFEPPRIIADGVALPIEGIEAALNDPATFNSVPIISGTNRDELKLFFLFNTELTRQVLGRFPRARDPDLYDAASDYQSRMWRLNAVDSPARRTTAGGHEDFYAYRFDWDEARRVFVSDFAQLFGAAHSLEIPFVFGNFNFLGEADRFVFTEANAPGRFALSDAMMSYWANFAATGAPGRGVDGDLPEWAAWSSEAGDENLMVFDSPADGGWRMIADQETETRIVTELLADDRLDEPESQCQVFDAMVAWRESAEALRPSTC